MNLIETTFYAGIGLALKGKEKIEEAAKKFAEDQKMGVEEGRKFVDDVMKSSEQTKEELTRKIDEGVKAALDKMGMATKAELEELKTKVASLEKEIKKLKGK